jgi:hypothetical protein
MRPTASARANLSVCTAECHRSVLPGRVQLWMRWASWSRREAAWSSERHGCGCVKRGFIPASSGGGRAAADIVVSSFGLRTFNCEQQQQLARVVAKLLRPGGVYSFIEISVSSFLPLHAAYLFYLKRVIPVIGWLRLGISDCYCSLGCIRRRSGTRRSLLGG